MCVFCPSVGFDSVIPWIVAHQAALSMGFTRQEFWNRLPFPPPGDLPDPVIKPRSPALRADSLLSEPEVKNPPAMHETWVPSLENSMVGHSPWGHKESDTTE